MKNGGALRFLEGYRLGVRESDPTKCWLIQRYIISARADELFELLCGNDGKYVRRFLEGFIDRFDHFLLTLLVWNDPDGDRKNTIVLALLNT